MAIIIANNTQSSASLTPLTTREATPSASEKTPTPATKADKVTLGGQTQAAETYAKPSNNVAQTRPDVTVLLEESNRKVQEIIQLILPLLEQQGLELAKVVSGEQRLTTDAASIEKAKADIAEDGVYGVRQVAERILNFAKSAIGDDPAKLATIRAAVEKGFKEATDILGGALPDISQKTYTAIMAQFDRWESEGIPSGAVSLAQTAEKANPDA